VDLIQGYTAVNLLGPVYKDVGKPSARVTLTTETKLSRVSIYFFQVGLPTTQDNSSVTLQFTR